MDGHGGNAVSKYLRQNLYARYLQARATANVPSVSLPSKTMTQNEGNPQEGYNTPPQVDDMVVSSSDESRGRNSESGNDIKMESNGPTPLDEHEEPIDPLDDTDTMDRVSLQSCVIALKSAFEKIDAEVQRISHWSYQGSTALAVKLHKHVSSPKTVLIAANVGDSRAVLCRGGKAVDLTKDHKPNDPEERKRIEGLGGRVEWFGKVDEHGQPLERKRSGGIGGFHGVYRINRNLSLSRAIGDRSELPFVCSTVDISCVDIDEEVDRFIILATDGLWDVFSCSQEVVDICQNVLEKARKNVPFQHGPKRMNSDNSLERIKNKMSKQLVREALRRGSMDNITVMIIWL